MIAKRLLLLGIPHDVTLLKTRIFTAVITSNLAGLCQFTSGLLWCKQSPNGFRRYFETDNGKWEH